MSYLAIVSFATIIISVAMAINTMFTEGSGKNDDEAFPSSSGGFWEFFNSLSGFAFAYAGQTIYLEMMSEMKKPTKFRQALSVGAPGIFVLYMATAIIQYALRGKAAKSFLIDEIPDGSYKVFCSVSLLIHMLISYNITNQVLTRALHLKLFPRTVNGSSPQSRVHWFACSAFFLFLAWLLANAIPFFDNLTGIIGAMLLAPISFVLPCIFYLKADKNGALVTAKGMVSYSIGFHEKVACVCIASFGIILALLGTISNLKDTVEKSESLAAPFSCNVFNASA